MREITVNNNNLFIFNIIEKSEEYFFLVICQTLEITSTRRIRFKL